MLNDVYVFLLPAGCVIKNVRETAALMFGVSVKDMVGRDLAEFIPQGCPSKKAEDLLIVGDASTKRGGLGANKKAVGKLMPLVSCSVYALTHDTEEMHCSANLIAVIVHGCLLKQLSNLHKQACCKSSTQHSLCRVLRRARLQSI